MNYEYKYLDALELRPKLEDALYDDFENTVHSSKGHTEDLHVALNDGELISRIANENKSFSSSFYDKETADDAILNTMVYKSKQICDWITKRSRDFDNKRDFQQLVLSVDMGDDEMLGRGFNDKLEEIESTAVKVVLQRDFDYDTPFGFYLKSAYVDIEHERAEKTGLQYTHSQAADLENITFKSSEHEIAFRYQDVFPDVNIRHVIDRDRQESIKISFYENANTIDAYITQNDARIRQYEPDKTVKRLSLDELTSNQKAVITTISHTLKLQYVKQEMDERKEKLGEVMKEKNVLSKEKDTSEAER